MFVWLKWISSLGRLLGSVGCMTTIEPRAKNSATPIPVRMDAGQSVAGRASDPACPLATGEMDWIPTGPGKSFRPLRFEPGGWSELMCLEPGRAVALHPPPGEVH